MRKVLPLVSLAKAYGRASTWQPNQFPRQGNKGIHVKSSEATQPRTSRFFGLASLCGWTVRLFQKELFLDIFQSRFFNVSVFHIFDIIYIYTRIYEWYTYSIWKIYNHIFTCCLTGFPAGCQLILTNPTHPSRTCKKSGPWHGDSRPRPLQLCGIPYFTYGMTWAMYPNLMCCITLSLRDCCVKCCKSILPKLCSSVSPRPKCFVHFIK